MKKDINKGDRVVVTSGKYKGFLGKVIGIEKDCYEVNINVFKDVTCLIKEDELEKDKMIINKIDEEVINRYLGKKDYVVRIRLNKTKTNIQINVYYDGRKVFEVKDGKLILDDAYFFLKGNKVFDLPNNECIKNLMSLGFSFTMGSSIRNGDELFNQGYRYRIKVECSSNKELYIKNKDIIKEIMNNILIEIKKVKDEVVHRFDSDSLTNYFYIKDNKISYNDLLHLQEVGLKNTVSQEGIKKIDFNENIRGSKDSYEGLYDDLDKIMEERINAYNKVEEDSSEKSYQQKLMNKMFDRDKRENLYKTDYCPFLNSHAFEMEYNLFEDSINTRTRSSRNGRVDNIFVKENKILFTELKYNEDVIGGTNGIHKHLIDLVNGFEKNNEALKEIYDYICDRNNVLYHFENKKFEYVIDGVKRYNDNECEKEFIIICGYSSGKKDDVLNRIKQIYLLKGTDNLVGIKHNYEIDIDNKNINLEDLNCKELITILKDRYNCEVKIYLVDDNYTEFDKINDLLK